MNANLARPVGSNSCTDGADDVHPRGALVLLCGLPAAGKTTLAAHLLRTGARQLLARLRPSQSSVRVIHFSFDDVLAQLSAGSAEFSPDRWHEARNRILEVVRSRFAELPARTSSADSWAQLGRVSEVASTASSENESQTPFDVVLLDDNMQYRSMRR